jgi:hypothetical protein
MLKGKLRLPVTVGELELSPAGRNVGIVLSGFLKHFFVEIALTPPLTPIAPFLHHALSPDG